jgi:inner membrane protein
LRQQDLALLLGAIALFIVLAVVMYVTRKIDWYARDAA